MKPYALAFCLSVLLTPEVRTQDETAIRVAVTRSLPLLENGAAGHRQNRTCFACHNQALPMLAATTARLRGFEVDDQEIKKDAGFIATFLGRNKAGYLKGKGQGGQADTAGYALWTLEMSGWKADDTTSAVVEYLLQYSQDRDFWNVSANRPPSEVSRFTTAYLALRALKTFGTLEQQDRIGNKKGKVRDWLLRTPAKDTEDRVFRLWALRYADASEMNIRHAKVELINAQKESGGWAQIETLEPDAYATGSSLVALHEAGMSTDDPVYQRGVRFLIDSQRADGSWHVRSRSKPFQEYFETSFPHGKDQFISIAASGWATAALALSISSDP